MKEMKIMNVNKVSNSLWIVECPVKDFCVTMLNSPKKVSGKKNFANAHFFQKYDEASPKAEFTLPIGHCVCDVKLDTSIARHYWCDTYMKKRGPSSGTKVAFDGSNWEFNNKQFHGKMLTTLTVKGGVANIQDLGTVNLSYDYAVMGVPLMLNGKDVIWKNYVKPQGWYGNELYGTYHTILAIKGANAKSIYVIGWKSTTDNMISSGEAYRMLSKYGFYSAIKLDGGGSFIMDIDGSRLQTFENRLINTVIEFGPTSGTTTATTSGSSAGSTKKTGKTTANLNMRTGPGQNYTSIHVIPKGATVTINTGASSSSWYNVTYGGKTGYCSASYITTVSATSTKLVSQNPYSAPTRTLKRGCSGNDVKWLQWMLVKLNVAPPPGSIDGSFGPSVYKSVVAWQKANGLSADGSFGPASRAKMLAL